MIIELQNFGPIKSFKFDTTKDMHAIFGKNNIGKSYAISAVYLILKGLRDSMLNERLLWSYIESDVDFSDFSDINVFLKSKNEDDEMVLDMGVTITNYWNNKGFLKKLEASFYNTFEGLQTKYTQNSFKITITFDQSIIEIGEISRGLFAYNIIGNDIIYKFDKYIPEGENIIYINEKLLVENNLKEAVFHCVNDFQKKIIHDIEFFYYLPASRSGLYDTLNSFGAIFAEISRNRHLLTSKFEIPNLSEPISDYFLNLNTISSGSISKIYVQKFNTIESDILEGSIDFDDEAKKIYYTSNNSAVRLELSFTSSMISEIAPIIAHLKYIIPLESDKPSILFIEEPEAHLHPEIQILLIEYFVKLCKGKVKIVMTSHSNYIFNKLSNLLIAKEIDAKKLSVMLMKMTPEGSVVEDGAMHIDEYGIEDNNFVDVAEQLYEERMALLEKL